MKAEKTTYSKIVALKKKLIGRQIVPASIAPSLDAFFNALHNARIQAHDRARDRMRDTASRTKDRMRDIFEKSADVTGAIAKATLSSASETVRTAKKSTDAGFAARFAYPFVFSWVLAKVIAESIALMPWKISEKSDKEAVAALQRIVANSDNVRARIMKYYGRESEVIYPPIETGKLKEGKSRGYWLSVNRLTPEKRIDMQIEAFRQMPEEKLVIVGGCDQDQKSYADMLQRDRLPNIRFAGSVTDEALVSLYSHSKGLITTSIDEDFGMNAVEAMAAGKPVVAPDEGGYRETVLDGQTGALIRDISTNKIAGAIRMISETLKKKGSKFADACTRQAEKFSAERFKKEIGEFISKGTYLDTEKQLIFIVGVPRSGTTWLWGLLTSRPDVEPILKSDFLGTDPVMVGGKYDSVETNMLFDNTLIEIKSVLAKKRARFIIEKTPDHLLNIERIRKQFPAAKIIHVMRNPFSVYASYKNSDWNMRVKSPEEWLPLYLKRIQSFLYHRDYPRMMSVSYEELQGNPAAALRKIFRFAGMSEIGGIGKIIDENRETSKSRGKHSFRSGKTDSWKRELSDDEIRTIYERLKRFKLLKKEMKLPILKRLRFRIEGLKPDVRKNTLVFIAGIPRSGTTWLWRLLSEHKDVDTLRASDFGKADPEKDRYLSETNMLFDFAAEKIRRVVSGKKAKIVLEKTPLHITKLDAIRDDFPDAKVLNVIRNPVSIYASYKMTEFGGWEHAGIAVEEWVKIYKGIFSSFAGKLDSPNILTVSYDAMLKDAKSELMKVYDFLGLSPENIDEAISSQAFEKTFPVFPGSPGKLKFRKADSLSKELSDSEISYIREHLKEEISILEKLEKRSSAKKNE